MNPRVEKYLIDNCSPADTEAAFDAMLNECYSFEKVGGPFSFLRPAEVLRDMLPTDYRCGHVDWLDGELKDGRYTDEIGPRCEHFDSDAVDEAVDAAVEQIEQDMKDTAFRIEELEDELENAIGATEVARIDEAIVLAKAELERLEGELSDVEDDRL